MGLFRRSTKEPELRNVVALLDGSTIDRFHETSLAGMRVASVLQTEHYFTHQFKASAVYRGSMILADLVAQLPLYAYRGGDPALTGQQRVEKPERLPEQPSLLISPNVLTDRDDLLREIVLSLIFHGNAYLYGSLLNRDGLPTNITVAPAIEVTVAWNANRTAPIYHWNGNRMQPGINWWHLSLNKSSSMLTGIGPLEAGDKIVAGILAADDYARRLFTQSGTPTGVLTHPGKLTPKEAKELKQLWDDTHQGGRGTGILAGGLEFKGISITPEQAQFLATRAYGAQEASRLLGIPQWFLNAGSPPGTASALTYQNLNQVFVELTRTTLRPTYLRRIEKTFSKLLPRGQMVQFDLSEFLRADLSDRASAAGILIKAGYDPDDVSATVGLEIEHTGDIPSTTSPALERQLADAD